MTTISNNDDVIDSRDVIERIEELEGERDALVEAIADAGADYLDETQKELSDWDEENKTELDALKALAEKAARLLTRLAQGYSEDWQYGAALVRDSYFEDYARELLKDIGDILRDLPHYIEIDWEATARNIRMDYTSVEFDGVTYWVR